MQIKSSLLAFGSAALIAAAPIDQGYGYGYDNGNGDSGASTAVSTTASRSSRIPVPTATFEPTRIHSSILSSVRSSVAASAASSKANDNGHGSISSITSDSSRATSAPVDHNTAVATATTSAGGPNETKSAQIPSGQNGFPNSPSAPGLPQLPGVQVPSVGLPSSGIPSLPTGDLPHAGLPNVGVPGLPTGDLPHAGLPNAGVPGLPTGDLPHAGLPSTGDVEGALPHPSIPSIALPNLTPSLPSIPSAGLGSCGVRGFALSMAADLLISASGAASLEQCQQMCVSQVGVECSTFAFDSVTCHLYNAGMQGNFAFSASGPLFFFDKHCDIAGLEVEAGMEVGAGGNVQLGGGVAVGTPSSPSAGGNQTGGVSVGSPSAGNLPNGSAGVIVGGHAPGSLPKPSGEFAGSIGLPALNADDASRCPLLLASMSASLKDDLAASEMRAQIAICLANGLDVSMGAGIGSNGVHANGTIGGQGSVPGASPSGGLTIEITPGALESSSSPCGLLSVKMAAQATSSPVIDSAAFAAAMSICISLDGNAKLDGAVEAQMGEAAEGALSGNPAVSGQIQVGATGPNTPSTGAQGNGTVQIGNGSETETNCGDFILSVAAEMQASESATNAAMSASMNICLNLGGIEVSGSAEMKGEISEELQHAIDAEVEGQANAGGNSNGNADASVQIGDNASEDQNDDAACRDFILEIAADMFASHSATDSAMDASMTICLSFGGIDVRASAEMRAEITEQLQASMDAEANAQFQSGNANQGQTVESECNTLSVEMAGSMNLEEPQADAAAAAAFEICLPRFSFNMEANAMALVKAEMQAAANGAVEAN